MDDHRLLALLPQPKSVEFLAGQCSLGTNTRVSNTVSDSRIKSGVERLLTTLRHVENAARLFIARSSDNFGNANEYRLTIQPNLVELIGASPAACFWGLQTLRQLARDPSAIPCCVICDWPDFETRGLLHDVTRGKVPTLNTLKMLVDRLTALKVNQLQLYIEHAFAFSFDPDICSEEEGLTPDEIRELDRYARERFIDLVPSVATFGHMGRILSMPRYRHLAEIEATKSWEEMTWPERMRGFTLDCMNPEAHKLVERIWSDILECFSSPIVNICGDEPWDLGRGKNKDRLTDESKGIAYLDQIRRTHDFCAKHGRRAQFWSDVVTHYPHLFERIPKDSTILHWGYDDRTEYEKTREFVETGLPTVVCPGVSGWKRVLNGMNLAERNIATFAAAGKLHGAVGLLNTDWGDHGHFNLLACSWHGIALGAAFGWNADHPVGASFDGQFFRTILNGCNPRSLPLLRGAARLGDLCESWRLLWQPIEAVTKEKNLPDLDTLGAMIEDSVRAPQFLQSMKVYDEEVWRDTVELALACLINHLAVIKIGFALESQSRTDYQKEWAGLSERILTINPDYEKCWMWRNKPHGFSDIRRALEAAAKDAIEEPSTVGADHAR